MTAFEVLLEKFKVSQKSWLVTGNAGFIGSNLTEFLLAHNQKVIGLDNFSTGYRHNIDDVLAQVGEEAVKNFTFIEGDIADLDTCIRACDGVDIVLIRQHWVLYPALLMTLSLPTVPMLPVFSI